MTVIAVALVAIIAALDSAFSLVFRCQKSVSSLLLTDRSAHLDSRDTLSGDVHVGIVREDKILTPEMHSSDIGLDLWCKPLSSWLDGCLECLH
jgi:hypothetical protein